MRKTLKAFAGLMVLVLLASSFKIASAVNEGDIIGECHFAGCYGECALVRIEPFYTIYPDGHQYEENWIGKCNVCGGQQVIGYSGDYSVHTFRKFQDLGHTGIRHKWRLICTVCTYTGKTVTELCPGPPCAIVTASDESEFQE